MKRFKEQESIDNCVAEAKDLLSRLAKVGHLDPATVDWDDLAELLIKARTYLRKATCHAFNLEAWARIGKETDLRRVDDQED